MQKPDFEAEAHFSQPFRQIAMMLVVLGLWLRRRRRA